MIEWNEKQNENISIFDENHKRFISIINKTVIAKLHNYNSKKIEEVLNEMIDYAWNHFKTEESYMLKFNYPEYPRHKEEHLDFILRTIDYSNRVTSGDHQIAKEVLEYLNQWQDNHIQGTDKMSFDRLRKIGVK